MANERVIGSRLPLLNEGKFEATIVSTTCKKRDWCPNIKVLVLPPKSEGQFGMNQLVVAELEKFPGSAVLSIQGVVHCRPNIKFGLHVHDMRKPDVYVQVRKMLVKRGYARQEKSPTND